MMQLLANSTINIERGLEQFSDQPVQTNITPIIADIINGVIIIGALLFLVYLILGGISWVTAGGDKGKVESAREKIIQGFIGLAVLVFAYTIYLFVLNYLNIGLTQSSSTSVPARPSNWIGPISPTGTWIGPPNQ